ncbi:MAG TPA: hypothetical protein VMY34_08225 [Acidimicrobiales bacterium]|nr:hypothetical protein [Acidimicrobiales bacterium]
MPAEDPVLRRRAGAQRLAVAGQRIGYALFGWAIVAFVVGVITDFAGPVVTVVIGSLLAGSVVLAPAIVLGYAVKAATRHDAGLPSGH